MLKHNLLIIYRNFKQNKSSFFINLIGLSTGLACALLIYLWVDDELKVDKFFEKDSQLYQVFVNFEMPQEIKTLNISPAILAEAMAEEMPEVEVATATNAFLFCPKEGVFLNGNAPIKARGMFADKNFFDVFSYNLIHGNKNQVLVSKTGIVISESLAKKLFNTTENILGKSLDWKHSSFNGIFQIAGVFEDVPTNSTRQFDVIFSFEVYLGNDLWARKWTSFTSETCIVLKKGTNIDHFNDKIKNYLILKSASSKKFTLFVQQYSEKYLGRIVVVEKLGVDKTVELGAGGAEG